MPLRRLRGDRWRDTLSALPGRFELISRNVTPCDSYFARRPSSVAAACLRVFAAAALGEQHDCLHVRQVIQLVRGALLIGQPEVVERLRRAGSERAERSRAERRDGETDVTHAVHETTCEEPAGSRRKVCDAVRRHVYDAAPLLRCA